MSFSKDFLEEFIEAYRNEPILWNTKLKEYYDREMKAIAYERLVEMLRAGGDPHADRMTVVRKINALRSTYRKELKKEIQHQSQNRVFVSNLWYFNIFKSFLNDNEEEVSPVTKEEYNDSDENTNSSIPKIYESLPLHTPQPQPKKIKAQRSSSSYSAENIEPFTTHTNSGYNGTMEDRFDIFGKHVAYKLRDLSNIQRIFAEKLINDALYEAELENLTSEHKIVHLEHK